MTPEELAYHQNFLYPLGLLLVGGGISGGLIPLFNFLHKRKLLEIEQERELSQKRIDRDREDYKFELEIKSKILDELTELDSRCLSDYREFFNEPDEEKQTKLYYEYLDYITKLDNQMNDYLVLYFNSSEKIYKIWHSVNGLIISIGYFCTTIKNSPERKEAIETIVKVTKIEFGEATLKNMLETTGEFPDIIMDISLKIRDLKLGIKKTKINLK